MNIDDNILQQILIGIRDAKPISDRVARQAMWDRCWSGTENVPAYFDRPVRIGARFVDEPGLEQRMLQELLVELFNKYLVDVGEVNEFGCGVGSNLDLLVERGVSVRGFDWSPAAVAKAKARGIAAETFDMFHPHDVELRGAVLTVHALEQLGTDFRKFLWFLINAKPSICIHVEPIAELYDETELLDFLALCYHNKRGYLKGFLPALRMREEVEMIEVRKSSFGNVHHMAYACVIWRPR